MCRFLVYKGTPRYLADYLIRPGHSLIQQSHRAREMPGPLNGDGFGAGWYSESPDPTPCLFTSLTPAWSNRNLRRLALHVRSACFFAHVRASTGGVVSEQNCHPFRFGRFLWMHNGRIPHFERVVRRLRQSLRDDLYGQVEGTTDSEHAFYVYLTRLTKARAAVRRTLLVDPEELWNYKRNYLDLQVDRVEEALDTVELADRLVEHLGTFPAAALRRAMSETLEELSRWTHEAGIEEESHFNFALTDGRTIVVTRYVDRADIEPPSLYFSRGLEVHDQRGQTGPAVLVSSEPLDDVYDQWHPIPANHMLVIHDDCSLELCPLLRSGVAAA